MDIGGGIPERPMGTENSSGVFNSDRMKTVGVLVGFLVLFFLTLVVVSYV